MPDLTSPKLSDEMLACIQLCVDCHKACVQTIPYCLEQGGEHAAPHHIGLLIDCAEICQTSANFMMRSSDLHGHICGACAEVCERCAVDCEKMSDDHRMAACAEMCQRCADSCRKMSREMSH
jgi:hypothetical protein